MTVILDISIMQRVHIGSFYGCLKVWQGHKKDVELSLLPVPRVEALALPIEVEQTTSEPTPI